MLPLIALNRYCLARLCGGNGGGASSGGIFGVVTDEPDLERAARGTVDENGVILYHENLEPGLNGFWVEAKDLREGDVVLGANGELSVIVDMERVEFPDGITVYNFTVDDNYNYFVIAQTDEFGQTSILVHNQGYVSPERNWYDPRWIYDPIYASVYNAVQNVIFGSKSKGLNQESSYQAQVGSGPGAANPRGQIKMRDQQANYTNAFADEVQHAVIKKAAPGWKTESLYDLFEGFTGFFRRISDPPPKP